MEGHLTEAEAQGMTVNERLFALGLLHEFVDATNRKDVPRMRSLLNQVYLSAENVEAIVADADASNRARTSDV